MSVAMKVAERIGRIRKGVPFSIKGFYTLGSRTSVQKAMSRLAQQGVIERVARGFYARPKPLAILPSINTTAHPEQVARAWARQNGYKMVVQGQEAAYRLGFQTQAPMQTVYWTNGPSREFKVRNQVVRVRHVTNSKLKWQNKPKGALLRGLLVTPPEAVGVSGLLQAACRLSLSPSECKRVVGELSELPILAQWENQLHEFMSAC